MQLKKFFHPRAFARGMGQKTKLRGIFSLPPKQTDVAAIDGNEAAARIAYAVNDISFIFPITPATPMGEHMDAWSAAGKKNVFGNEMQVTEMDSEASVAGSLHGALAAGGLATTFTSSQGLLLMIPNMYKIAGELTPCVIHVAARALAGQALSIFGDHQDVMAVRQTGWAMLSSHSVQEAHDMALAAHMATLLSSIPFVHFFDGFRTSHEINKINTIPQHVVASFFEDVAVKDAIARHHSKALNPTHPHQRGTSQGPDVYFQMLEAANPFYARVPDVMEDVFTRIYNKTGRQYKPFEYIGNPEAEHVIIIMGSGSKVVEETIAAMSRHKIGVIKVRLYRPWSARHFLNELPETTMRIAVLDRTKESGSVGEPLYTDVVTTLASHGKYIQVVGGRYGLGSKDFTPTMVMSVFENLRSAHPKNGFTVGIIDDVTNLSLPLYPTSTISTVPNGTFQCVFWGMGSDGTVGANKDAIKIIADNTDLYTQAYFAYDAHKSGGVTISHMRFGPNPISSQYLVSDADYVAVHNQAYVLKYNLLENLKPGGIFVLNTNWNREQLEKYLPLNVKRRLAELDARVYTIDASAVAESVGLGKRINMVMQTVFFSISGVIDIKLAQELLKKSIAKTYDKKGSAVIQKNQLVVDMCLEYLDVFPIPVEWRMVKTKGNVVSPSLIARKKETPKQQFVREVAKPMLALEGDKLPVSVFQPGGVVPPGTTEIEKRETAAKIPIWLKDDCSQCNICAFVCPHAAIRPVLASEEELRKIGAPDTFAVADAKGGDKVNGLKYRMQVSPLDCTGCSLCVHTCPDNALKPMPLELVKKEEEDNWNAMLRVPEHPNVFARDTVKGSQFLQPLLEFSGACEGCGETPYVKLLTQLFGERMLIANATGCSSIWGGSAPVNPYTTNKDGRGPAWANSLFEDNASFGFGIYMATKQRRDTLVRYMKFAAQDGTMSESLRKLMMQCALNHNDAAITETIYPTLKTLIAHSSEIKKHPFIVENVDMLVKPSCWIIGGDGWAYDIGYGGLDHVISTGENVNILVLDTEMYSNTGGQKSKATPLGAVAKFAASGKTRNKKDLGMIAMQYGDVYVASVCLEANYAHVLKVFKEAESYEGVSIVIAYAPCVMQGINEGMQCSGKEARLVVDAGYWPLYRYDPRNKDKPFHLDSKGNKGGLYEIFKHETRFNLLKRSKPELADKLHHELEDSLKKHMDHLKDM